jgi:hypothetical protein
LFRSNFALAIVSYLLIRIPVPPREPRERGPIAAVKALRQPLLGERPTRK